MHAEFYSHRLLVWLVLPILMLNSISPAMADLPPVRVWGDISSIYRQQDFMDDGITATNWLNLATINASTYIWHPWFALVNGSLTLSDNQSDSNISEATDSRSLGGSFNFNLFPTSRFPFLFYVRKTENEQETLLTDRTSRQTTIGVSQQYTSKDGKQSYIGRYETIDSETIDFNNIESESFDFAANFQLEENAFSADVSYDTATRNDINDEIDSSVSARHSYTGSSDLRIENLASASRIKNNFNTNTVDTRNNQFTSFASWNPGGRRDMNLTGNFRISEQEQFIEQQSIVLPSNNTAPPKQTAMNLNQGFIYHITDEISLRQSINLNQIESENSSVFNAAESLGLIYTPDSVDTSLGIYNWNAGITLGHQHGDETDSTYSLISQLGHSLARDFLPYPDVLIKATFNQSVAYTTITDGRDSGSLNHSASLGWTDSDRDKKTAVRASISDSRSLDDEETTFQLINLQANQSYRYSRTIFFAGEATYQYSRVTTVDSSSGTRLLRANVSYTDNRFMNWHGVRFRSKLNASMQEPTNARDIVASDDSANTISWENDLLYRIGLFESRISLDYIKDDNKYDRIIIIQLTRNFGDL